MVEPTEESEYAAAWGRENVLALPFHDLGLGSVPARNWLWEYARAAGHARHWCLDDNLRCFYRRGPEGKRIRVPAGAALRVAETFADRYENLAVCGLAYKMFCSPLNQHLPPFYLNVHAYSCLLIDCALPFRWRGRYNEDTDLCLQALSTGRCTALINAVMCDKVRTMLTPGGNTAQLYASDGRLKMARALERVWPGTVGIYRRWGRAQHYIKDCWRKFDTKLRRKPGCDPALLPPVNEMGLELTQVREVVKSAAVRSLIERYCRPAGAENVGGTAQAVGPAPG